MNIKKTLIGTAAAALMLGSVAGIAFAASFSNGSFETGTYVDGGSGFDTLTATDNSIDNWTVTSGSVDWIGSYWPASEGNRSIDLTGYSEGTISQSFTTVANHTYKVTFDLSGNPAGDPSNKELTVSAAAASQNFSYDTSVSGNTLTNMKWEQRSFNFTATGTSTTLTFTSLTAGFFGPALDNVTVTDVTPIATNKDQCKNGGWQTLVDANGNHFKNQGDCVSYVATKGKNPGSVSP